MDRRSNRYAARQGVSDFETGEKQGLAMSESNGNTVAERSQGIVKFFNEEKGFGFCRREGGASDVFVHANALKRSGITEGTVKAGDKLEFDVEPVEGKGPKAIAIKILSSA